ncbi:hypothetical protein DO70_4939 [Burkholderia pseudomallei]|nr:hypothetical protein DO70_4939 [Burkholderia pseudomallei]
MIDSTINAPANPQIADFPSGRYADPPTSRRGAVSRSKLTEPGRSGPFRNIPPAPCREQGRVSMPARRPCRFGRRAKKEGAHARACAPSSPPIRRRFEQARYSLPHHDDDVLRGIPNPPRSAASGCFGAFFSGCTGFASSGWFADGDGTYGFRKKSSIGASRRG